MIIIECLGDAIMYTSETLLRLYKQLGTFDKCAVHLGMNRKTFSRIWYEADLPSPKHLPKDDIEPEIYKVAACSDMHFGSNQQALTPFLSYIQEVLAQNIRTMVIPGDICEGLMPRQGHPQLRFLHSIDSITNYVDEVFSLFADDFTEIRIVCGNHDESLNRRADGFNICTHLSKTFSSVKYNDNPNELITPFPLDGGIKGVMYHGTGGCQKNLSNRSRSKTIDYLNSLQSWDCVMLGHCHRFHKDYWVGKHAFNLGCFQSTTHFLASKGLTPMVQGEIISYNIDKHGMMQNVLDVSYNYDDKLKNNDFTIPTRL